MVANGCSIDWFGDLGRSKYRIMETTPPKNPVQHPITCQTSPRRVVFYLSATNEPEVIMNPRDLSECVIVFQELAAPGRL